MLRREIERLDLRHGSTKYSYFSNKSLLWMYMRACRAARMMVATKRWLDAHLLSSTEGSKAGWAVVPSVLIVPDGDQSEVEAAIDRAIATSALDAYSERVVEIEQPGT